MHGEYVLGGVGAEVWLVKLYAPQHSLSERCRFGIQPVTAAIACWIARPNDGLASRVSAIQAALRSPAMLSMRPSNYYAAEAIQRYANEKDPDEAATKYHT